MLATEFCSSGISRSNSGLSNNTPQKKSTKHNRRRAATRMCSIGRHVHQVGRALFETEKKRYTILDAPGHKNYVPNMIGGAALADVGVLVISARKARCSGFEGLGARIAWSSLPACAPLTGSCLRRGGTA
jgi:translation elongation factor EF-G